MVAQVIGGKTHGPVGWDAERTKTPTPTRGRAGVADAIVARMIEAIMRIAVALDGGSLPRRRSQLSPSCFRVEILFRLKRVHPGWERGGRHSLGPLDFCILTLAFVSVEL